MQTQLARCGVWALILLASCEALLYACPNCKEALANDPAQAGLVRGFFWSILFMLSMPFLILSGLGSYFYWEVCRARRATEAAAATTAKAMAAKEMSGAVMTNHATADESSESAMCVSPFAEGSAWHDRGESPDSAGRSLLAEFPADTEHSLDTEHSADTKHSANTAAGADLETAGMV